MRRRTTDTRMPIRRSRAYLLLPLLLVAALILTGGSVSAASDWQLQDVVPSGQPAADWWAPGWYSSLAVDRAGVPHVAYRGQEGTGRNEVQQIVVSATAGTFTVTVTANSTSRTTGSLPYDVSAVDLQSALWGLPNVGDGDVIVTGGPGAASGGTPYVVTFQKELGHQDVAQMTTAATGLAGGTAAVTTLTPGLTPDVYSIMYAYYDGTKWRGEKSATEPDNISTLLGLQGRATGYLVTLALDPQGRPHIAFATAPYGTYDTHYRLRYASWDGSSWKVEDVEEGPTSTSAPNSWTGMFPSLAIDASGTPHVSYTDCLAATDSRTCLGLTGGASSATVTEVTKGGSGANEVQKLVVDATGGSFRLRFGATSSYWTGNLSYNVSAANLDAALEQVARSEFGLPAGSDALSVTGGPGGAGGGTPYVIAFQDGLGNRDVPELSRGGNGTLMYATKSEGVWTTTRLAAASADVGVSGDTSLALDGDGHPHVAYLDRIGGELMYASLGPAGWTTQRVAASAGFNASLAFEGNLPRIAYTTTTGELRYVVWDGASWVPREISPSVCVSYDSTGGMGPDLEIDPSGVAHFAYAASYDTHQTIMHGWFDATGWHSEPISDTSSKSDWYPSLSLALDRAGRPRVTYFYRAERSTGPIVYASFVPPDTAPSAENDSYSTDEDTQLHAAPPGVLANDSDAEGDPLTAVLVANVTHGLLTLQTDGSFVYTPNADYNGPDSFTYRANDGGLDSTVATVSLTVNSVDDPPLCSSGTGLSTEEDTALDASVTCTDIDGGPLMYSKVSDPSHGSVTVNDDGSFTYTPDPNYNGPDSFTYRADDGGLDSTVATVSLTVDAVDDPPVVTADSGRITVDEGETANTTGAWSDVDANDAVELTASVGSVTKNENGTWTWSYATTDGPGDSRTVTVTAKDGSGATAEATFSVVVDNIAPTTPNLTSPDEGSSGNTTTQVFTWDPSSDAAGTNDTITYHIQVYGNSCVGNPVVDAFTTLTTFTTGELLADGTYCWWVQASDEDAGSSAYSAPRTLKIDRTAPSAAISQAADQADPTSASAIHFTAVFTEPVTGFGNGSVTLSGTAGGTLVKNVTDSGDHKTFDVAVSGMTSNGTVIASIGAGQAQDAAGNGNTASSGGDNTVTWQSSATNAAPTVTITSPTFGSVYAKGSTGPTGITPLTLTASFGDPDNGPWTYSVNWDDPASTASNPNTSTGSLTTSGQQLQPTHKFTTTGVFTINVCLTDGATPAATGCASVWIVVYDASAGFVTGGGWLNVGAGSYAANPLLTGRANFGFNSQYKKGATVPTGDTEFNFQIGNLDFHSTTYSWLVVSGYKAQFKGVGTVNGSGKYNFALTAYDGAISGGGGIDKFRIMITDGNNGNAVIFDNRNGRPLDMDTADPQAISGGSIVIHKA